MEERELDRLAEIIVKKFTDQRRFCPLDNEEQQAVKDLIRTKRNAVRVFLWLCGAFVIWVLKDVYNYIMGHLSFR